MIKTIKHRLFITFGSLTAFICVLLTAITWLFAAITEDEVLKHLLATEAEFILNEYEISNQITEPRVDYMQIYFSKATLPEQVLQGYLANPYEKEFYVDDDNYHIGDFVTPDGKPFYITLNAAKLEGLSTLNQMIWTFLLIASSIVLFVSLLCAWLLSNRSAKPLQRLSQQIEHHDFADALPSLPIERHDEIGTLSRAFASALQKISMLLEREREFTCDVSHELRTPMTLIKNTIQLSQQQPLKSDELELIAHASNELEQTVDVLLALARQENLNFSNTKLTPILEKCVLKIYSVHPEISFNVDIQVDDQFSVYGNAHLISLLCQNLINNAFYHSKSQTMAITTKGNCVVFENAIDGHQTKPYYQGLGHGHYLVKRIVEEMSWQIEAQQYGDTYRVAITVAT